MRFKTKNTIALLAGVYALMWAPAEAASPEQKAFAHGVVDRNAQQAALLSDSIYYFAEPGMQEIETTKLLRDTLQSAGFQTELGIAGMPTALWAQWGKGGPKIVISTESDGIPGGSQKPGVFERQPMVADAPGHMEGHNTNAATAVAAAYAIKRTLEQFNLPGTIAILFGPGEQQLVSRPFIIRAGYLKDADAVIFLHLRDTLTTGYGLMNSAAISSTFTFHGKSAHAGVAAHEGKDALDAVQLMDVGFAMLRQKLRPTDRGERIITMGGLQPNLITETAQIWWTIRGATMPEAKVTYDKLMKIAEGAALMTGTTFEVRYHAGAWPQLVNKVLAEAIQKNIDSVGVPKWTDDDQALARKIQKAAAKPETGLRATPVPFGGRAQNPSANDAGDISWNMPAGLLGFPVAIPGVAFHSWPAALSLTTPIAHKGIVAGAKVLSGSVLDMMTDSAVLQNARAEFRDSTKNTPYSSLLPADASPPVELNREAADRARPEMRKFYLSERPRFE